LVSKATPPFIPFEGVLFGDFAGIQENEDKVQVKQANIQS
jgi:hypothetical protein